MERGGDGGREVYIDIYIKISIVIPYKKNVCNI